MKKLFLAIIIFFNCSLFAQLNIDSVLVAINNTAQDSIDVSKLVWNQIEAARLKEANQENQVVDEKTEISKNEEMQSTLIPISVAVVNKSSSNKILELLNSVSIEIKIFFVLSALIILSVSLRRVTIRFKKKIKNSLKQRIAMIREERVIVKKDKNISRRRKLLKKDKLINNLSEAGLNSKARELSIAKGELLLAARLKSFSYGK